METDKISQKANFKIKAKMKYYSRNVKEVFNKKCRENTIWEKKNKVSEQKQKAKYIDIINVLGKLNPFRYRSTKQRTSCNVRTQFTAVIS